MKIILFIFSIFFVGCRSLHINSSNNMEDDIKKHKKVAILPVLYNCDCYDKKHLKSDRKLAKSRKYQQLLYGKLQKDTLLLSVSLQPIEQTNAILDSLQIDFRTIYCNAVTLKNSNNELILLKILGVDAVVLTEIENRSLGLLALPITAVAILGVGLTGGNESNISDLISKTSLQIQIIDKKDILWEIKIKNSLAIFPPIACRKYLKIAVRKFPYKKHK